MACVVFVVLLPTGARGTMAPPATRTLTVKFSPPSGTVVTTANPPIQVSGCETFYAVTDAVITVHPGSGGQYTQQPPGSGNCTTSYSARFDLTNLALAPGWNTVVATVFNAHGDGKTDSATYFYRQFGVDVSAGLVPQLAPGASGSVQYWLSNTGSDPAHATLTASCPSTGVCTVSGTNPRLVTPGQTVAAYVAVTAPGLDGTWPVQLRAVLTEDATARDSATATVTVQSVTDSVVIQPLSVQVAVG